LIPLANNGLLLPVDAQQQVITVPVTTPAFIVTPDTEIIANVNLTAGAGGTILFYGINLNCSFNFN